MNFTKQAIEKAIKLAIEGGWKGVYVEKYEMFLLDPLFWQALGKSLGWEEHKGKTDGKRHKLKCICISCAEWLYHWHLFIDWIAEGKDIESYFKDILEK